MTLSEMPLSSVVWNVFLAAIPVALAEGIARTVAVWPARRRRLALAAALLVWLAFLPNTCYLLTEWRHYLEAFLVDPDSYWDYKHGWITPVTTVYTLGYAVYSLTGLVTFYLAVRPLERVFHPPARWKAAFFMLCAVGVYLGLAQRFNSWDLVTRPASVLTSVLHASWHLQVDAVVMLFAVTLWLCYEAIDVFFAGLRARFGHTDAPASQLGRHRTSMNLSSAGPV